MKKIIILLALIIMVFPSFAGAASQDDIVMMGQDAHVAAGNVLSGSVVVIGADAVIEGHVRDSVVVIFGNIRLESNAIVDGSVVSVGGSLDRKEGAQVGGEQVSLGLGDINIGHLPRFNMSYGFFSPIASLWKVLSIVFLGWVIFWLIPAPILKIAGAAQGEPLKAVLFGLLGYLAVIPVSIMLLITLVGIPLIPFFWLALLVGRFMGQVALGLLAGRYLAQKLNREMTDSLVVAMGLLVLGLVTIIPVVGGLVSLFYSLLGFGATLWTKFGRVAAA
ncbi:MAG: hypothetical protein FD169_262 [Bacillota bacterium]|nr:MAG: hypothetical protein FD169_262 [Bacillota bacterium]